MNDSLEGEYSWKLASNLLKDKDSSQQVQDAFKLVKEKHPYDSYIWSFTLDENNMALQNYGDIAVVMNPQKTYESLADKYTNPEFKNMHEGNAYILPLQVIYDSDIQVDYLSHTLDIWLKFLKDRNQKGIRYPEMAMYLYSLIFKHPKYHQEEEIRYIINKIPDKNGNGFDVKVGGKRKLKAPFLPSCCDQIIVNHRADNIPNESIDTIQSKIKKLLPIYEFGNTVVKQTDLEY